MNIVKKNDAIRETGQVQSSFSKGGVFTESRPVDKRGNPLPMVVAMVAKCVAHYRKYMKPLKAIYLSPSWYVQFTDWVRYRATEEEAECKVKMFTFDGVEINMMEANHIIRSKNGTDEFDYDFYPEKRNDA